MRRETGNVSEGLKGQVGTKSDVQSPKPKVQKTEDEDENEDEDDWELGEGGYIVVFTRPAVRTRILPSDFDRLPVRTAVRQASATRPRTAEFTRKGTSTADYAEHAEKEII